MTWFKVDDHLHSHPKTWATSLTAMGLWAVAGSWSSDQLTDGFIPQHMVMALARGQGELAEELVEAGLWERAKNGYQFHEWDVDADGTVRNPTRDEALTGRKKMSSGGELGNHRRWHEAKGKKDPSCRYCQRGGSGTRSGGQSRGDSSGRASGSTRPDANPMSDSTVDNSQPDISQGASDQQGYRVPDQVGDRVPDSPPSPPSPVPVPSRPEPRDGGTRDGQAEGSQSVHARARVREALRWLSSNYGLTDIEAARAWEVAEARAPEPIRNPLKYLNGMIADGSLAAIVDEIQTAGLQAPADEPEPTHLRAVPDIEPDDEPAAPPAPPAPAPVQEAPRDLGLPDDVVLAALAQLTMLGAPYLATADRYFTNRDVDATRAQVNAYALQLAWRTPKDRDALAATPGVATALNQTA